MKLPSWRIYREYFITIGKDFFHAIQAHKKVEAEMMVLVDAALCYTYMMPVSIMRPERTPISRLKN